VKVISFYSNPPNTTYYSDCAKNWIKNVKSFDLDYHIEELKSDKDYWANTRKKPKYILEKLNQFKEDVLWVDVDLTFKSFEEYESYPIIALKRPSNGFRIHACALHFKYCDETLNFLNLWIELCETYEINKGDHHFLYKAIQRLKTDVKFFSKDMWDTENQIFSPFGNSI
jgi:hypothetical protein